MSTATLPPFGADKDYKTTLLSLLVSTNSLKFGSYILKSGRESPYFLTTTPLHTAPLLRETASAFANVISSPPFVTEAADRIITPNFHIIFPGIQGHRSLYGGRQ
jgi:orotate phosphoribosyltransferase